MSQADATLHQDTPTGDGTTTTTAVQDDSTAAVVEDNPPRPPIRQGVVQLKSRDGDVFELSAAAAHLSGLIQTSLECQDDHNETETTTTATTTDHHHHHQQQQQQVVVVVEIPKVNSPCLDKVVAFCEHHATVEPMREIVTPLRGQTLEEIVDPKWYRDFVVRQDRSMLFQLVTAANFLEIPPLFDLTCLVVSMGLMGKTAEEIRKMLHIPAMSPEELEAARREHPWIFDE